MTHIAAERREWLRDFYNAQESYNHWKDRCPVRTAVELSRMLEDIDKLSELGAIRPKFALPTIDELEGHQKPRPTVHITPFLEDKDQDSGSISPSI